MLPADRDDPAYVAWIEAALESVARMACQTAHQPIWAAMGERPGATDPCLCPDCVADDVAAAAKAYAARKNNRHRNAGRR